MKKTQFLCFIIFFCFINLSNAVVDTLSLNSATPSAPVGCFDTWSENSYPFQVVPIPPDDDCFFDFSGGGISLFPARLTVDLSGILGTINSIEIDIYDNCGVGCTLGEVTNAGITFGSFSNTLAFADDTLVFTNTNNLSFDQLFIESFEGFIDEIRIDYTITPPVNDCFVVVPFDAGNPNTPSSCNDTWNENYMAQQVVPIPPSNNCSFNFSGGELALSPALLKIDLSNLTDIQKIEIDITSPCGIGCTIAEVLVSGNTIGSISNSASSLETLTYTNSNEDLLDELFIQSSNGIVSEVRIFIEMESCIGELTLEGGVITTGTYSGCSNLMSSSVVVGTVSFISENDVILTPGFVGAAGSDFTAGNVANICFINNTFTDPSITKLRTANSPELFQILQNPTSESLRAVLKLESTAKISITIHDLYGQQVSTIINGEIMDSGLHQVQYDIDHLSSGIYYVTVWENNQPTSKKVSVVH